MTPEDGEAARRRRAAELRREYEALRRDEPRPPSSPHEFVEQQMRRRDQGTPGDEPGEERNDG